MIFKTHSEYNIKQYSNYRQARHIYFSPNSTHDEQHTINIFIFVATMIYKDKLKLNMRKVTLFFVIGAALLSCQKQSEEQPAFPPQKGEMVSKDVRREKPESGEDYKILYTSENDTNLKNSSYTRGIYILTGDSPDITPPPNYTKIPCDLNKGAGGKYIYLCLYDEDDKDPLTALKVYAGGYTPSPAITTPWTVVENSNGKGYPGTDLNEGAGGDWIYVYESRHEYSGDPITKIGIAESSFSSFNIPGWQLINVDLNKGAGGKYIWFIYQN